MKTSSKIGKSASAGMTLMEVTISVGILTVLVGVLTTLGITIGDVSTAELCRTTATDEARRGMQCLTAQLRNASKATIPALPTNSISFQAAQDLDGNGASVDDGCYLELGPTARVKRDVDDENHDGIRMSQLILSTPSRTVVLADGLLPDEDVNANRILDGGEDTNGNGVMDHGIWFERVGNAVRITLQAKAQTRRGNIITYTLTETVLPRN